MKGIEAAEKFADQYTQYQLIRDLHDLKQNIKENIEKTGYVVGDRLSMADIAVVAYLTLLAFNPKRAKYAEPIVEKFPFLKKFMDERKKDFGDYLETRKITFLWDFAVKLKI